MIPRSLSISSDAPSSPASFSVFTDNSNKIKQKKLTDNIAQISANITSLKRQYYFFSVVLSINHALNYVVTSYATSLLPKQLATTILGLSWLLNCASGLTVATVVVSYFGYKYASIIGIPSFYPLFHFLSSHLLSFVPHFSLFLPFLPSLPHFSSIFPLLRASSVVV